LKLVGDPAPASPALLSAEQTSSAAIEDSWPWKDPNNWLIIPEFDVRPTRDEKGWIHGGFDHPLVHPGATLNPDIGFGARGLLEASRKRLQLTISSIHEASAIWEAFKVKWDRHSDSKPEFWLPPMSQKEIEVFHYDVVFSEIVAAMDAETLERALRHFSMAVSQFAYWTMQNDDVPSADEISTHMQRIAQKPRVDVTPQQVADFMLAQPTGAKWDPALIDAAKKFKASTRTIARRIEEARKLGLLPPAKRTPRKK